MRFDRYWRKAGVAWVSLVVALVVVSLGIGGHSHAGPPEGEDQHDTTPKVSANNEIDTSIYVRSDSDRTTVVSPRIRFRQGFEHQGGETNLDLIYATDAWTSASVDIRTAASPRVFEQRDEIGAAFGHRSKDGWELGLGYRLSTEPDFLANGLSLSFAWEGMARNVRLESRISLEHDRVGRSGDPLFARRLQSVSSWFGYTQVLSRSTLMQLAVEQRSSLGYHASPYRWVGLGGASDCSGDVALCVPEVHPDRRARFAFVARLRQGLGKRVSVGLDYRYYIDSWALQSHTIGGDLRIQPTRSLMLAFEYRGYLQNGAWFYQSAYPLEPGGGFATRDRELSPMLDHRATVALDWSRRWSKVAIGTGLLVGAALYRYGDFIGLSQVIAVEGSWIGRLDF